VAGHNKWSKIKRKKAINDSRKGANFSKLTREIQVAVREGGGPEPESNFRLKIAIDRARQGGLPNDNIERAVQRASGVGADGADYETVQYEGYGPGGVAVIAIALTDNRNRTAAEIRSAFNRHGGALGESGSVAWQFNTVGQIVLPVNGHDPDELSLQAIDAGASDVTADEEEVVITTEPADLNAVAVALRESGLEIEDMSLTRIPQAQVDIEGSQANTAIRLLEALEDLDDVSEVYTNASFSEEMVSA
jgi:YebC/PmpR family DNA-binding regulatory protein